MLTHLPSLKSAFKFRSLSTSIVIAMCAGLLVPALIGIAALNYLRQDNTTKEI